MEAPAGKKRPYAAWQKTVLAGCLVMAVIGTVMVVGGMVRVSSVISEYGGTIGAPVVIGFIMGIISLWLFAASGAILVHVAKTSSDIADMVESLSASSGGGAD